MRKKKKGGGMLKKAVWIVLALIVVLVAAGIYLGVHSTVKIEKAQAGPYYIVCLDHIGPYKDIAKKFQGVKKLLDEQKITPVAACGIFYDDPRSVPSDKLRSKGGYIVTGKVDIEIAEELKIPKREAVIAKVKAHPAVAAVKTYPKIHKWLNANNYVPVGPCLEIYYDTGVVEVQMPIHAKAKPKPKVKPKAKAKPKEKPEPKPKPEPEPKPET